MGSLCYTSREQHKSASSWSQVTSIFQKLVIFAQVICKALQILVHFAFLKFRNFSLLTKAYCMKGIWQVEQKPGGRGRGREWATLGVHPLSWLLSNNQLEKVPFVSVPHTASNRLLLSNQDKGCTPSVVHSLALPLIGPALLNLWILFLHLFLRAQKSIGNKHCAKLISYTVLRKQQIYSEVCFSYCTLTVWF